MPNTNSYQLFVSNQCTCCNKVVDFINSKKLNITTINIDNDSYELPFNLLIIPALVKENKLVSYGFEDITNLLDKN